MGDDPVAWVQRQRSGARCPSRAICLSEDDRALGKIALRLPAHASPATTCEAVPASDRPAGELSYWLVPAARGRGLAGAAVTAMLATEVPGSAMRSVILDIEETNVPSIRLAERLGAAPGAVAGGDRSHGRAATHGRLRPSEHVTHELAVSRWRQTVSGRGVRNIDAIASDACAPRFVLTMMFCSPCRSGHGARSAPLGRCCPTSRDKH